MSGLQVLTVTGFAFLMCDKCHWRWESEVYKGASTWNAADACSRAFRDGWRIYKGKRSQYTYCPRCSPTVPMEQVYPLPIEVQR